LWLLKNCTILPLVFYSYTNSSCILHFHDTRTFFKVFTKINFLMCNEHTSFIHIYTQPQPCIHIYVKIRALSVCAYILEIWYVFQ
jgi:hypothetical protein